MDNSTRQSQSQRPLRRKKLFPPESIVITVCVIIIAAAIIALAGNYYIQRADSRVVLQQAKATLLAMQAVSVECYGGDTAFADQSADGGFAKGMKEKVKELSGCPGEIYLLQWDARERRVVKFCYVQGSYAATYKMNKNQEIQWDVFRVQSKM